MGGLLQDEEDLGQRRSHGSYGNEDDAPLLGPGRRGVRRHREDEGRLFNLRSRIRLPSFISTTSHLDEVPNNPPEPDSGKIDPGALRTILVSQLQKSYERFIMSFLLQHVLLTCRVVADYTPFADWLHVDIHCTLGGCHPFHWGRRRSMTLHGEEGMLRRMRNPSPFYLSTSQINEIHKATGICKMDSKEASGLKN
jgi:hypothetical protein